MTRSHVRLAIVVVPAAACALVALALASLWADLGPAERAQAHALLTPPRIGLLVLFALALAGVLAYLAWRWTAPAASAARRIAEDAKLIAHGNPGHRIALEAPAGLDDVARAVNDLAQARSRLLADVATTVSEAKAGLEKERERLAALVAELDQSVLVCNRDGRVLLYNAAAQALLRNREQGAASVPLGLGRPVSALIDAAVVQHALEGMERHVARGESHGAAFVTTSADGRLLRVRAAPVVSGEAGSAARELTGYVLLLSDVTAEVEGDSTHVALFQGLVESTRAALANIRAAIENLTGDPQMEPSQRERFAAVIRDESIGLSDRLNRLASDAAEGLKARWPLEEMRGEDLLTLARSRIERRVGLPSKLESVDPQLWLRVDSFPLAQGLTYLAQRLREEFRVREVRFRLLPVAGHAQLDVLWIGPPMSSETAFAWQSDPFDRGGEDSTLTLEDVMERHGGEAWYQRDVPSQMNYFRLLLPLAESRADAQAPAALRGRPEFYDFDLFRRSPANEALDDTPLADLVYTVFDTETTGLDPTGGDEIIAIGAVRIVNGRLLPGETFETLVDPMRTLPEASVAVHGITQAMLAGQPTLDDVLPRLARFAEETVLVGHNAAFDLRFLQLKQARTGIVFDHPVLDTLLLSAVVHPAQAAHAIEDIAARLGVDVVGRHTALGDALTTAEIFLKLVPLLAERGIVTLGDARKASEQTYYARLKY